MPAAMKTLQQQVDQIGKLTVVAVANSKCSTEDLRRVILQSQVFQEGVEQLLIELAAKRFPCEIYAHELIPEGYTIAVIDGVVQDVEPTLDPEEKLVFPKFHNESDEYTDGKDLLRCASRLGIRLGLADAKRVLQCENPADPGCSYVVFTGTILQGPDGHLYVLCLYRIDGRLVPKFRKLIMGFNSSGRLICSAQH